jgi:hypothetical protein
MSNPFGSYESQCDDFVDSFQEHCDFEAGAENMELRAMRLEAERDAHQEAMFDAMDMLDEMNAARESDGEVVAPAVAIPTPVDFGDDDIPF